MHTVLQNNTDFHRPHTWKKRQIYTHHKRAYICIFLYLFEWVDSQTNLPAAPGRRSDGSSRRGRGHEMRHRCRSTVRDRCCIAVYDVTTPCKCAYVGRDAGIFCRDIEPACGVLGSLERIQNSLAGLYWNNRGLFCNDIGLVCSALVRYFGLCQNDSELCCGDAGLYCNYVGHFCNDIGLFCHYVGFFCSALVQCFGLFSNNSELCCVDTRFFCTSTCCLSFVNMRTSAPLQKYRVLLR